MSKAWLQIAHRLESVMGCDEVAVMDGGRVVELCMQRHDTLEGLARGMVMMASRKHVSFQILWCVDCQAQYCCDIDTGCIKICWRYMFSSSMHGM